MTGRPEPIAAAIGSSTRCTSLALTRKPLSFTARRSTCVISGGTPMTSRGRTQRPLAVRLAHEMHQHLLGRVEVGNDAVLHRADRLDVRRRPAEHLVRLGADRLDLPLAVLNATMEGSLRTMPRPAREDAGVGRAEIDGDVGGECGQQVHVTLGPTSADSHRLPGSASFENPDDPCRSVKIR